MVFYRLTNSKGLVFDLNNVPTESRNKFVNNGLIGYRVEYLNSDGANPNFYRIVTSSFFMNPTQNLTNSNQKILDIVI